jgi:hypothetical protein
LPSYYIQRVIHICGVVGKLCLRKIVLVTRTFPSSVTSTFNYKPNAYHDIMYTCVVKIQYLINIMYPHIITTCVILNKTPTVIRNTWIIINTHAYIICRCAHATYRKLLTENNVYLYWVKFFFVWCFCCVLNIWHGRRVLPVGNVIWRVRQ